MPSADSWARRVEEAEAKMQEIGYTREWFDTLCDVLNRLPLDKQVELLTNYPPDELARLAEVSDWYYVYLLARAQMEVH